MTEEELVANYPQLFHMAEVDTWPQIQRHGLLSTSALLDLFEIKGEERFVIESQHRPECVTIRHKMHGTAVIRDQKPMSDKALLKCLAGLTPQQWYETLNRKTFFWLDQDRLFRLLQAKAYRDKCHCVLTLDTAAMLERHTKAVRLSHINSGSTIMKPQPRGADTFLPIAKYPFGDWKAKRNVRDAVVELTVDYAVPDVREFVLDVCHMQGERVTERVRIG